jgi:hypothetical protein
LIIATLSMTTDVVDLSFSRRAMDHSRADRLPEVLAQSVSPWSRDIRIGPYAGPLDISLRPTSVFDAAIPSLHAVRRRDIIDHPSVGSQVAD